MWHELGYAVDLDTGQNLSRSLSRSQALDELSVKVSSYAGSSMNARATKRSEAWAENFAAYMSGENKDRVPSEISEMIENYFNNKTGTTSILESNKLDISKIQKATNDHTKSNSKLIYEEGIPFSEKEYMNELISEFKEQYSNQEVEYGMLLSPKNKAFVVKGTESSNDFAMLSNDVFKDVIVIHNHPNKKTHYSFSASDVNFFLENGIQESHAFDNKFEYKMKRTKDTLSKRLDSKEFDNTGYEIIGEKLEDEKFIAIPSEDEYHVIIERLAEKYNFKYKRRLRK